MAKLAKGKVVLKSLPIRQVDLDVVETLEMLLERAVALHEVEGGTSTWYHLGDGNVAYLNCHRIRTSKRDGFYGSRTS